MNDIAKPEFDVTINEEERALLRAGLFALRALRQDELNDRFTSPRQKRKIENDLLKIERLLERNLNRSL